MITEEQYKEMKKLIKEYENEQILQDSIRCNGSQTTTIPQELWGVHRTHCCVKHGCKYDDKDCPVKIGIIEQDYSCEYCDEDNLIFN
ncbi:hypothetical protein [Nonlabens sp.]|uniref:hypothetical protein n=1 Tax=Nonlabens sp. TaxID=1888209 RepID=UPI0025DD8D0F|nr:hypothetical protein [Nonlabens sp.]